MTVDFGRQQLARRMALRQKAENYCEEMQSLRIGAGEEIELPLWNVYLVIPMDLIPPGMNLRVESDCGVFDPGGNQRRMSYEHTGQVRVINYGTTDLVLPFIAAIEGH